jgi:hypothetical protein
MRDPWALSKESEQESYELFDKYVRPLPKKPEGTLDLENTVLQHNDVDAFRHAYVSAVFTQEYGDKAARLAGWINERFNFQSQPGDENMDFWNNAVGRKFAKEHETNKALARAIKEALDKGQLITSPDGERQYEGTERQKSKSSVVVLKESKSGANEIFFDLLKSAMMTRNEFIAEIEAGLYKDFIVKIIDGIEYPVSLKDSVIENNLG